MKSRKTICVVDVKSNNVYGKSPGHYFSVASNYKQALEKYREVHIVGGPVYRYLPLECEILPCGNSNEYSKIKNKINTLRNVNFILNTYKDACLILQSCSVVTTFVGLLLNKKHSSLFLIQYDTEAINSKIKKILYLMIKSKIKGIICPNSSVGKEYDKNYIVLPDYFPVNIDYSQVMRKYEDYQYDFCFVGIITKDKGVIEALRIIANLGVKIMVAGLPDSDEIRNEIIKISNDYKSINLNLNYIDKNEYDHIITNSRYCVLNYSEAYSNHSSGVVLDVIYHGTPIIGKKCKSLDFVSDNKLGLVYSDLNVVNWDDVLNSNLWELYRNNIKEYLINQQDSPRQLIEFIDSNS